MIGNIIGFLIIAIIAGFLARAIMPGKDSMSILHTLILGAVGSFIGGFLGYAIHHNKTGSKFSAAGIIGSVIGALIALFVYNRFVKNKITH
jgi:uncharacterized membrane protein YeaQ/YmgE (transglycosylase-associated protein family)